MHMRFFYNGEKLHHKKIYEAAGRDKMVMGVCTDYGQKSGDISSFIKKGIEDRRVLMNMIRGEVVLLI